MMQLELKEAMKKEVQRMHSVEHQLADALKMLAKMSGNPELKQAFEDHRHETVEQAKRLEAICAKMGWPAVGTPCLVVKAMGAEILQTLNGAEPSPLVDALIIGAAQKSEHLEIAAYGTLIALAKEMGDEEAAGLMAQSLAEEKAADERLTRIAESAVNARAVVQTAPPSAPPGRTA